jgi:SHS2 domain-containing protein
MMVENSGFKEIEHTADSELHVWAPDMPALLVQAAKGMYALLQTRLVDSPRLPRDLEIPFQDRESLIVDFLSELLFYAEDEAVGFDTIRPTLNEVSCKIQLVGAYIKEQTKEIKAVTYHGMQVKETESGFEVNIVFDV